MDEKKLKRRENKINNQKNKVLGFAKLIPNQKNLINFKIEIGLINLKLYRNFKRIVKTNVNLINFKV